MTAPATAPSPTRRLSPQARRRLLAWGRRFGPWVGLCVILLALHGGALLDHIANSAKADDFNDDARQQIYPFYRYSDGDLLRNDTIGDYYLDCLPMGYRALYTIGAYLGDAAALSKVVPYVLLLLTVFAMGLSAGRLGGIVAAGFAMALVLGSMLYLSRMGGGLPRAFAFPLLAGGLAALVCGRARLLALLVCVGAGFYPAAAVTLGLALGVLLLLLPAADRGDARSWTLKRRVLVLGATATIAAVILLPTVIASAKYAPVIRPTDVDRYPEAGPGGRYGPGDRAPFSGFFEDMPRIFGRAIFGRGAPYSAQLHRIADAPEEREILLELLLLVLLLGGGRLMFSDPAARRVLALALAAFIGHGIARLIAPYFYLPQRYVMYPTPIVGTVMLAASLAGVARLVIRRRSWHLQRTLLLAALSVSLLLIAGARGHALSGLTIRLQPDALYDAIEKLPKSALIAGWPGGAIENVPYVTRRAALITYETHQAFHGTYVLRMRRRMRALIDATFATSLAPLERLRRDFGVTHLLIVPAHLRGQPPRYFRPFQPWIRQALDAARGKEFEVLRQMDRAAVYRDGGRVLLDLARVAKSG